MKGVKFDGGKIDWTLIPFKALSWVVKVLEFGSVLYARDNWRKVPNARERYKRALMRHATAFSDGEIIDPDSKLPHLACLGCNVLFLLWFWIQDGCLGYNEKEYQKAVEKRRKEANARVRKVRQDSPKA